MADISEYLETLKTAIYGEDMRSAIIGAITLLKDYGKIYEDLSTEFLEFETDFFSNKEAVNGEITNLSNGISNLQNRYTETSGKNIFHADSIVEGKFLNYTNGAVNTNADYFYTQNAINVEPNTTYTGSWYNSDGTFNSVMTAFMLFYNASNEFVSGTQLGASALGTFKTPENCYYIRYSGVLKTWNSLLLQIEKGDTHSENYEAYYKSTLLKDDYIPIDYIKSECNKKSYIYVDKNGNGDYITVTEAVANAEDGATIVVAPGNYENETIEAWGREIHIVGVSPDTCIISNEEESYLRPPVEIGCGSLRNLTIIAKYKTGTSIDENGWLPYAVHTEDDNLYNGELTIDNCILASELNAALGLGMRGGCTVTIKNTQLIGRVGTGNRALYFHDAASAAYAGEQNINIINCQLESDSNTTPTLRIVDQCVDGSNVNLAMVNNLVYNAKGNAYRVGTSNADGGTYDGWRNLKNTTLSAKSFGNNIDVFNS